MTRRMARKGTLTHSIEQMRVGEKKEFPAEQYTSVVVLASNLGFKWKRKYTSHKDTERRIVTITRTA